MLGPVLGELIPKANRIWPEGKFYLPTAQFSF